MNWVFELVIGGIIVGCSISILILCLSVKIAGYIAIGAILVSLFTGMSLVIGSLVSEWWEDWKIRKKKE